jgi:glycosyltransferase involved in cell wall biosynthesis
MLKILFDHQCFSNQEYGGVSRYFVELIKNLKQLNLASTEVSLKYSNNHYLNELPEVKAKLFLRGKNFTGKKLLLNFLNESFSRKLIREKDFNIFHPTYYDPYFLKSLSYKPFVLTVYDMTHELFPDSVHKYDKSAVNKKLLIQKASKVIAISNNTKKDIINILNVSPDKIEVIHLASSLNKKLSLGRESLNLPDRYILYVGSRKYYKNFHNIFYAFKEITKNDDNLSLICAGGGKFNDVEIEMFVKNNLTEKILYKPADDISLATLYSNALVFVFPSFYEGFGIPALEAMNCDCPLALSNVSSLPEIAGDAAVYFDPYNKDDIVRALSDIIYDDDKRAALIENARKRREDFSWIKTATKTFELYKKII